MSQSKKVVIIGGGYGGVIAAINILKSKPTCSVTIIDKRKHHENKLGLFLGLSNPAFFEKNKIDLQTLLPQATVLVQNIKSVVPQSKKVIFQDGTNVDFDYLIIASGRSYELPIEGHQYAATLSNGDSLEERIQALRSAKDVTVVGAGSAGIEIATEISEAFPNVTVHLISSDEHVLSRAPAKVTQAVAKYVASRPNIKVHSNSRATAILPNQNVVLNNGETVSSSVAILSALGSPNTQFLRENLSDSLDSHGLVQVNEYLQVKNWPNIFAIGDVNNTPEEKLASGAKDQAKFVANNLNLQINHKKLKQYKVGGRIGILVYGPKGAFINYSKGSASTFSIFSTLKRKFASKGGQLAKSLA